MLTMEGKALRDELLEYFEFDNTTPVSYTHLVESLNAAISASLLMYETGRQRRH